MPTSPWSVIILAAGKGSRLQSSIPKPLALVGGKPLIQPIIEKSLALPFAERLVVISEYTREVAQLFSDPRLTYITVEPQGTGHATLQALSQCSTPFVLIAQADDSYFYQQETLENLMNTHVMSQANFTLAVCATERTGYSSVEFSGNLDLLHVDTSQAGKQSIGLKRVVAGLYAARTDWLREKLPAIPAEFSGEYGLPSVFLHPTPEAQIKIFELPPGEWAGVNTVEELEIARKLASV